MTEKGLEKDFEVRTWALLVAFTFLCFWSVCDTKRIDVLEERITILEKTNGER